MVKVVKTLGVFGSERHEFVCAAHEAVLGMRRLPGVCMRGSLAKQIATVLRYISCDPRFKIIGDCAISGLATFLSLSLDMTDRPHHRILIEYHRIEIACARHCLRYCA
jgi:hypothetical protein